MRNSLKRLWYYWSLRWCVGMEEWSLSDFFISLGFTFLDATVLLLLLIHFIGLPGYHR